MTETSTIAAALEAGTEQLAAGDAPRLEAEVLLAHVLERPRSHLRTWPEEAMDAAQQQHYCDLIARRAAGEPVAYLTGHREFWSLDLLVNRHTLIPRPETERLVELALAQLPLDSDAYLADIGTGSGAVALAIAAERPRCRIIATDISAQALEVARANARRLNLVNVTFRLGDGAAPLEGERFDLIVSNPPYVSESDPHLAEGDLPAEPRCALVAGPRGTEILATLIDGAAPCLRLGGRLLLEHGYDQGAAVRALLEAAGYGQVRTWQDAAGIDRVSGAQRP